MATEQPQNDQTQFLLNDFNTRLRDIDERNKLIRERVLLLGKNLVNTKQETEKDLKLIKKQQVKIIEDLEKLSKITNSLVNEFNKFIKRDEMMVIERMLKDFQPLEFMRRKDVEELIEKKFEENKKK